MCTVVKHECLKHVRKCPLMFALWCWSAMFKETLFPGRVLCYCKKKRQGIKAVKGTKCEKEKKNQMTHL